MFALDGEVFDRYVRDFVMVCLLPSVALNFSACSAPLLLSASVAFGLDVRRDLVPRYGPAAAAVYAEQAFAAERAGGFERGVRLNGERLQGALTADHLLAVLCADSQAASCARASRLAIVTHVDAAFAALYRYDYAALGLYLTLALCGVFVLYTLGVLAVQSLFPHQQPPRYLPLSLSRA